MAEMGLFETIYSTRALRRFKPDPVPDELISKILEAGTQATSGGSEQHWLFIVVKDAEQRRRLGEIYRKSGRLMAPLIEKAQRPPHVTQRQRRLMGESVRHLFEHIEQTPVLLLACLKPQSGVDPVNLPPDVLAKTGWSDRLLGASIYPAVQNMILASRALGLGTVLTFLHALHEDEVKQVLQLPAEIRTYAMLPIGYPTDNFGPVKRKSIREVTCLDRYGHRWPG
jgi:nitroreductase